MSVFGNGAYEISLAPFPSLFVSVILGALTCLSSFHKKAIDRYNAAAWRHRKEELAVRKIIIAIAALVAASVFVPATSAEANGYGYRHGYHGGQPACPHYAWHNGRCYYGAATRRVVTGYRVEMVRRPVYRTVTVQKKVCGHAPCAAPAPCPAQTVLVPAVTVPCSTCGGAPAAQVAAGPTAGTPCTGRSTGRRGVWKVDETNGRLGCWVD